MTSSTDTKRRVTFVADAAELFDALQKVGDGGEHLGRLMVSAMLADPDFADIYGMVFYGVTPIAGGADT